MAMHLCPERVRQRDEDVSGRQNRLEFRPWMGQVASTSTEDWKFRSSFMTSSRSWSRATTSRRGLFRAPEVEY